MTAHQFHRVCCSVGARHWFPLSASMSVYPRNRTKWTPITRPIDLRWWRRLLDKASLFQRVAALLFLSSGGKMKVSIPKRRCWREKEKLHPSWIPKHRLVLRDGASEGSAEMTRGGANSGLDCTIWICIFLLLSPPLWIVFWSSCYFSPHVQTCRPDRCPAVISVHWKSVIHPLFHVSWWVNSIVPLHLTSGAEKPTQQGGL